MSISLSKKSNLLIGSIMLLIGILSYVFSFYIYIQPRKTLDITSEMNKEISSCISSVKNSDFLVTRNDKNNLLIESSYTSNNLDIIEKEIYKSSLIIDKCSTLNLISFCAGQGCENNKLISFKLSYPFEKISLEYN